MGTDTHDLAAGYVLDALAPDERSLFEGHLRRCDQCRRVVGELHGTAEALALAVPAASPPPRLREAIVEGARADRAASEIRPAPRRSVLAWAFPALATAAAAAALVWAGALSRDLDREREARADRERAVLVLASPATDRISLADADGAVVRGSAGEAALVVRGLRSAPSGRTYQAWVVEDGRAVSAGVFEASGPATVHALTAAVPDGAIVTVTVEPDGGVDAPTTNPILRSLAA